MKRDGAKETARLLRERREKQAVGNVWMRGYAAGLAAGYRVVHSESMVKHALQGDGLKIDAFVSAGVEDFDLDVLKKSVKP
jgi:hypothetical protein